MLPTMYQAIGIPQQEANLGNIILFYGQGVVSGSANSAAGLLSVAAFDDKWFKGKQNYDTFGIFLDGLNRFWALRYLRQAT